MIEFSKIIGCYFLKVAPFFYLINNKEAKKQRNAKT